MEKTISIKKAELLQGISQVISDCELPPCVVADTLQLMLIQIQNVAQAQLQKDLAEYNKEREGESNE